MISVILTLLTIPEILLTMRICTNFLKYALDHTLTSLCMFFKSDRILLHTSYFWVTLKELWSCTLRIMCVGIILSNTGLYKSTFNTYFLRNLFSVFLCFLFVLCVFIDLPTFVLLLFVYVSCTQQFCSQFTKCQLIKSICKNNGKRYRNAQKHLLSFRSLFNLHRIPFSKVISDQLFALVCVPF